MKPYRRSNKAFMVECRIVGEVLYIDQIMSCHIALRESTTEKLTEDFHENGGRYTEYKTATRLGKLRVLLKEFLCDVHALWHYGAPFPTFLKLIATLLLILLIMMPILYPVFVVIASYYIFEGLFLSWWWDQPHRFCPIGITRHAFSTMFRSCPTRDMWKVREVFTRGILLAHSLATSVDYLCVMQGLLDEA